MKYRTLLTALFAAALAGCVTINIYFPAAAAERAADKIIDQVLSSEKAPAKAAPSDRPGGATQPK